MNKFCGQTGGEEILRNIFPLIINFCQEILRIGAAMEPGAGEFALLAIAEPNHKNPWNSDSAHSKPPGGAETKHNTKQ